MKHFLKHFFGHPAVTLPVSLALLTLSATLVFVQP
jgi:hypothetical protein